MLPRALGGIETMGSKGLRLWDPGWMDGANEGVRCHWSYCQGRVCGLCDNHRQLYTHPFVSEAVLLRASEATCMPLACPLCFLVLVHASPRLAFRCFRLLARLPACAW